MSGTLISLKVKRTRVSLIENMGNNQIVQRFNPTKIKIINLYFHVNIAMCQFSRKHIECSMCRFATSCSIAYANHMMGFHSGQMTSLNLNIPWERPMKEPMHCLCGFASRYGNKIGRFFGE